MTFRNQMKDDLGTFFNQDEFGIPATIHIGSSESKDITIITDITEDSKAIFSKIQIKKEDFPSPNGSMEIDFFEERWRFDSILSGDEFVWTIYVRKQEKVSGKK